MKPLKAIPTSLAIFLLVVALLGFIDATYLTVEHFQGKVPPCSVTAGCENVLTSSYAVVAGIPISLTGVIYYFLIMVGVLAYLESKNLFLLKAAMLFTIVGLVASMWFVYVQVFLIGSYCLYCLGSAVTSTILFATAMEIFARYQE